MLTMTLKVKGYKFKDKEYIKAVEEAVEKEFLIAIKKWLLAVLRRTPTYTGTARGTYAPVGRLVGHTVRKGTIKGNAANAAKKKHFTYGGESLPLGFSEGANYSEVSITKRKVGKRSVRIFSFDQFLPYVLWNEASPGPAWFPFKTAPPWLALKAGQDAFTRHMTKNLPQSLPDLEFFFRKENG